MKHRKSYNLLFSQVASSLGSFGFLALAGRALDLNELGLIGVFFAWFYFTSGIQRSITSEIFIPRLQSGTVGAVESTHLCSLSTSLLIALVSSMLFATYGAVFWSLDANSTCLALISLLVWLFYDAQRAFRVGESSYSLLLFGEVTFSASLIIGGLFLVWFKAGVNLFFGAIIVSAAFASMAIGPRLRFRGWMKSIARDGALKRAYLLDFLLGSGGQQLVIVCATWFVSSQDVGSLRLVMTELGPQSFLLSAGGPLLLSLNAKRLRTDFLYGFRIAFFEAIALAAVFGAYSLILNLSPDRYVRIVFGENAIQGGPYMVWLTLGGVMSIVALAATVALRVYEVSSAIIKLRIIAVISLPVGIALTAIFGARFIAITIFVSAASYCLSAFALVHWKLRFVGR
ncbi:hypothetical protein [Rarobacter incanus]|uniref:Uncharacterized protein n=1 Tax=Rarobacter incanus TaxID=153494 RepID=A0A542SME2_9MICO|nr:hypothetical protein [Rarobacter incanus]TQK75738.1 hypothetical protein FB389_0372 [Rarobacter incanus]